MLIEAPYIVIDDSARDILAGLRELDVRPGRIGANFENLPNPTSSLSHCCGCGEECDMVRHVL